MAGGNECRLGQKGFCGRSTGYRTGMVVGPVGFFREAWARGCFHICLVPQWSRSPPLEVLFSVVRCCSHVAHMPPKLWLSGFLHGILIWKDLEPWLLVSLFFGPVHVWSLKGQPGETMLVLHLPLSHLPSLAHGCVSVYRMTERQAGKIMLDCL